MEWKNLDYIDRFCIIFGVVFLLFITLIAISLTVKGADYTLTGDEWVNSDRSYDNLYTGIYGLHMNGYNLYINESLDINTTGHLINVGSLIVNGTTNNNGNIDIHGYCEFKDRYTGEVSSNFYSNDYDIIFDELYTTGNGADIYFNDSAYILVNGRLDLSTTINNGNFILPSGRFELRNIGDIYYSYGWNHNNGEVYVNGSSASGFTIEENQQTFYDLTYNTSSVFSFGGGAGNFTIDNNMTLLNVAKITTANNGPGFNIGNTLSVYNNSFLDQTRDNVTGANKFLICDNLYMKSGKISTSNSGGFIIKTNCTILDGLIIVGNQLNLPSITEINNSADIHFSTWGTGEFISIHTDTYFDSLKFYSDNYIKTNGNDFIINGTLDTIETNNTFVSDMVNCHLILNGYWDLNNNVTLLNFANLTINGKLEFNNYSLQSNQNMTIRYTKLTDWYSIGEINITADINYPFHFEGTAGNTLFNMSMMNDYHYFNVLFDNFTNPVTDYITVHGSDGGTLLGNWDFTPPIITILDLINNTDYYKGVNPIVNFSFYMEELSYIHSYEYVITKKSNDLLVTTGSFNYSTPITNDVKELLLDITGWQLGEHWYNVTVYDTHNKLSKDAKTKDKLFNSKIRIGKDKDSPKVGRYDLWENTAITEIVFLEDFIDDKDIFSIEFLNGKDTSHLVKWLNNDLYFKLIHFLELKDNFVQIKLTGGDVKHIPNSYRFVINNTYYYDFSDFIRQDFTNNSISISHNMKDEKNQYYIVTLNSISWKKGDTIEIDPLSGTVNNAFTSYSFTVNATPPPIAKIESIILEGTNAVLTGGYDYIVNNTVVLYHWRSSIDGIFYNGSTKTITAFGFTPGTHTIFLKILDDNNTWSNEVNQTILIGNITIDAGLIETDIWYEEREQVLTLGAVFIILSFTALVILHWIRKH